MAINYDEINDNLLRVIANADEAFGGWRDLMNGTAKNVTLTWTGADGVTRTTTVPNYAKFVNNVYGSVSGALNRSIYVDAINGDDENDGSADAPKRTMSAAIASTPYGATVRVTHRGDLTVDAATEYVNIANRRVAWVQHADTPDAKIILRSSADAAAVVIARGGSIYSASAIETHGQSGDAHPVRILGGGTMIVTTGLSCNGVPLIWGRNYYLRIEGIDITVQDTSAIVGCAGGMMQLSVNTGATINGDAVTDVLGDWINGMVRDADSGNPVNVLCNINLSA